MPELTTRQLRVFRQLIQDTRRDLLNTHGTYSPRPNSGIADPDALAQSFRGAEQRAVARERQRQADEAHNRRVSELAMKIAAAEPYLALRGIHLSQMSLSAAGELLRALDIEHRDSWEIGGADPHLDDPDFNDGSYDSPTSASPEDHESWPE